MNIDYVGRHFDLDDDIRAFTEDKLEKVTKFVEEPIDVRVTLEAKKHRQIAELHVAHRFGVLQATEETESMRDAINLVIDKVEKQARRSRKKFIDRRRRADRTVTELQRWPMEVLERATMSEGQAPRVVKSTHLSIEPMTVEAAARRLDGFKNDFIVFRDPATDSIRILYKRRDENYGLLIPEP